MIGMDPRYPTGRFSPLPSLTPERRASLVAAIGSFPAELDAAIAALPKGAWDRPYREGGWTARQVVHHLADSHMNAFMRFRWALTEDAPAIKPYDEVRWAQLADSSLDPALSVQILNGLHGRFHRMLLSMTAADFARTATHPDHGPVTADWLLQMYAWHGRHHIGHLNLLIS